MSALNRTPSRIPLHPRRAAERIDPYWASMWRTGSMGDWFSADEYRALRDAGVVKAPSWLRMSAEDAMARVLLPRHREQILRTLAALDQWRTMTVQQVEAMADVEGLCTGERSLLSAMWNAGLVDLCEMGAAFGRGLRDRDALLLRPGRPGAAHRAFEETLSYVEWVSMTAGIPLDSDRQAARHNILATELGLRVAEFGNAAMVLGEKLSAMSLLAYEGVGAPVPTTGVGGSADLTIVRGDGLRVAVEMTASVGGGWSGGKVERLVRTLARRPLAETGLCALFVVAPRKEAAALDPREVLRRVKRDVLRAVRAYPGPLSDPTANRVGVVSWTDYFPAAHTAAPGFPTLAVERPTGAGTQSDADEDRVWEPAAFLDPSSVPFVPLRPEAMRAVIDNAAGLRGVPHMLRSSTARPCLSDLSVRQMGLTGIPQVEGTRALDEGRGATGARALPTRLVY
jgi:hypothetical protein